MSNPTVTHLLNDTCVRLCCAQDGPTAQAPTLLDESHDAGVCYCTDCARAVLVPILDLAQFRCDGDPLPPDEAAAVPRILYPVLVDLAAYIGQIGGHHD